MFKHLALENDFAKCWFDNYLGREGRGGEGRGGEGGGGEILFK
jgi:hypothetical protein